MKNYLKRYIRRSKTGQAIIILALGFIALLGFVGIVTDVSLLFVRFAALRRAVDSAAVAAAGQLRQDRDFGNVNLAARQFIEFHGISPDIVLVETCLTAEVEDDPMTAEVEEEDPELCTADQRKLVRVTAQINSSTVFLHLFGYRDITLEASAISETAVLDVVIVMDVSESMLEDTTADTWDAELGVPIKRYVPARMDDMFAQFEAQRDGGTTRIDDGALPRVDLFPREILGSNSEAEMLRWDPSVYPGSTFQVPGHTADLAAFDGLGGFTYLEFFDIDATATPYDPPGASGTVFDPRFDCRVRFNPNAVNTFPTIDSGTLSQFTTAVPGWGSGNNDYADDDQYDFFVPMYNFYGCCNDPGQGLSVDGAGNIQLPASDADIATALSAGDFVFDDLVCQPFKEARDATRLFLNTIDFARGDRVAFVTFDRSAYLIDPDGISAVGSGTMDHDFDDTTPELTTGGPLTHMIDDFTIAQTVLNQMLGVRAEPNFYYTDHIMESTKQVADDAGQTSDPQWESRSATGNIDYWDTFSSGEDVQAIDVNGNGVIDEGEGVTLGIRFDVDVYNEDISGNHPSADDRPDLPSSNNRYLTRGACPFDSARVEGTFSRFAPIYPVVSSEDADLHLNTGEAGFPNPLYRVMNPPTIDPQGAQPGAVSGGTDWAFSWSELRDNGGASGGPIMDQIADLRAQGDPLYSGTSDERLYAINRAKGGLSAFSYEHMGSCRGTNIGAGLRTANNALLDPVTTRRNGAVWIVVFISDGAAGASDVFFIEDATAPDGFREAAAANPYEGQGLTPTVGEYGAFGVCPYGTFDDPATLMNDTQPFCSDFDPSFDPDATPNDGTDGRHFCNRDGATDDDYDDFLARILPDPASNPDDVCIAEYDVDDYARDWADYVAQERQATDFATQLPTIFTIGFGLNYDADGDGNTDSAGSIVCNDPTQLTYATNCLGEELLRYIADIGDNNQYDDNYPDTFDDSTNATVSFGNYYNAPDEDELERVFEEIASRMFTRIAR